MKLYKNQYKNFPLQPNLVQLISSFAVTVELIITNELDHKLYN